MARRPQPRGKAPRSVRRPPPTAKGRPGDGPPRGRRPQRGRSPAKPNPLLQQATDEATTVFGPQKFALDELLRGYRSDVKRGVQADEGAARGIIAATKAASPIVKRVYDRAGEATGVVDRDLAGQLAPLSPAADPYRAVAARESAGTRRRMEESEAGALSELQQRRVGAQQGRGYAVGNLIGEYRQNAAKVRRSRVDLARQQAAHIGATFGDLKEARQKARMEERDFQLELSKFAQATQNANRDDRRAAREDRRQARAERQRIALQRRGQNVTIRGQNLTDRRAQSGGGSGGGSSLTPTQRRNYKRDYQKAVALLRTDPKWSPKRADAFVDALTANGTPRPISRAAVDRLVRGGTSPKVARRVRGQFGIRVPVSGRRKSRAPGAQKFAGIRTTAEL